MLLQRPPQSLLARSPQLLTALQATISPVAFFFFRSWRTKYQKRLLATVALGAKMRMRYSFGVGSRSVGRWRPMTMYSVKRPILDNLWCGVVV